jgi:uncharacterized protein (TIGR02099 family)
MLKGIFQTLLYIFTALLFLVAVGLTAARLWMPSLSEYRLEIEAAASEALKKDVSIGRLEATFRGLNPVLKLKNVELADPADEQGSLAIREVWITIDAERYATEQQLQFAGIEIIGTDITLVRDADGEFYLDKFRSDGEDDSSLDQLMQMSLLSMYEVNLTFIDELHAKPAQRFSKIALSLKNSGYTHLLTGHALLPADVGYRVDVEAELYGDSDSPATWQGQLYAKLQALAFTAMPQRYLYEGMALQGVADIRLWADVAGFSVDSVSGELDAHDLQVSHIKDQQEYHFKAEKLGGRFGWRRHDAGWQFALEQLVVTQQGRTWTTGDLSLAGINEEQVSHIKGVSSLIKLDSFGALLPIIPGLTPTNRQLLADLQPQGLVKELRFELSSATGTMQLSNFSAGFTGLGIGESGAYPLFTGLDGRISGNLVAGTVMLDSYNASIHNSKLFREALPLEKVQGDIHWLIGDERIEIGTDALAISNQDISLNAKFGVDFPAEEGAASINLALAVEHADVGRVPAYLPTGVMSPKAVSWLDNSLKSGAVSNGTVLVNGRFDQLPFDDGEGRLEVRLPVTRAELHFDPGWSPLTQLNAQVDFTGRSMDILGSTALMRTAKLENIHVQIEDLAKPLLTIHGDASGDLSVMLAELGSSALGVTYGGFVDSVTTSGPAALVLDIRLPLTSSRQAVQVSGKIQLKDNTLKVNNTEFELQQIKGRLDFDSKGIKGKQLHAELFDKAIIARVWTDAAGITRISLDGRLSVLDRYIPKDNTIGAAISGDSDWRVLVIIRGMPARGKKANVGVVVKSDLVGTQVDLPAPFGKDKAAERLISITINNAVEPVKTLRIDYGRVLDALLDISTDKQPATILKAAVTTGGAEPVLPKKAMVLLNGDLKQLHVTKWRPYLAGSGGPGLPVKLVLQVEELEVQNYFLNGVTVAMDSAGDAWNIKIDGEAATGDVQLVNTDAGLDRVVVKLTRLKVRSGEPSATESASKMMPADFPDFDVVVEKLIYNKAQLGQLELQASKLSGKRYHVETLSLFSELLDMQITGSWEQQGSQQSSSMELKVERGKIDRLMGLLGYQKSIEGGVLSGALRVNWPGAFWDFSPATAEGKLRIKIEDGRLLDVEPGAAGRVLGLTSLSKLPRRLLLDFSDLYQEGFSFDRIKGTFTLDGGNAYTNDLYVDGPAAKIEISGRIGLAEEDYDELVTVTPYIQSGLSLAGALAAGPAIGAVIIVADKLLENRLGPLSRIGQKQYLVTGPWSDPLIEELGYRDTQAVTQETKEEVVDTTSDHDEDFE